MDVNLQRFYDYIDSKGYAMVLRRVREGLWRGNLEYGSRPICFQDVPELSFTSAVVFEGSVEGTCSEDVAGKLAELSGDKYAFRSTGDPRGIRWDSLPKFPNFHLTSFEEEAEELKRDRLGYGHRD